MLKIGLVFVTTVLLVFSLSSSNLLAEGKGMQNNRAPFLITGKLPHLTKLLMQQWDNTNLQLSEQQKSNLLIIRKETIDSAQELAQKIGVLEDQVVEGSLSGKKPEELKSLVQDIAKLKSEATMVHLRCIYKTRNILDRRQLNFLTN